MEAPSEAELPRHDSEFSSYGGGIFPGSHHFTVAGGIFKNITKNYVSAPEVPPDFRMIPMGDINLQRQIRMDELRVKNSDVLFPRGRGCMRRMYSAKVEGRKSDMTVAVYEGETAEEEWRRDIAKYLAVRHPHILQVCGAASSGRIHATLFHGDLIPYNQFLDLYRHSPVLTAYIRGYTTTQYCEAWSYIKDIQQFPRSVECAFWIRRWSGLLCAEIFPATQSADKPAWHVQPEQFPNGELLPNLSAADQEAMAIRHLSLQQYHYSCSATLALSRYESISISATVTLAAVVLWPIEEQFWRCCDPVCVREVEIISIGWNTSRFPNVSRMVDGSTRFEAAGWNTSRFPNVFHMTDGSTRFKAADVSGETFGMHFRDSLYWAAGSVWLSQANLIFHRLQVIDNYLNYVVITGVDFEVQILPISGRPPTGYLFLCPPSAFQTGSSSLSWPDSPAYWSLDPLGVERLTAEDATRLGFPSMLLTTSVLGYSWDASVYAGLRQFHAAKGFDPDSQDVARHLGYPLYEPTGEMDVPFAHMEDEEEVEDDPSDEEKCSGVEGLSDEEEHLSGVERGPSPEATTANPLESTEPFNILEPSMSHTFKIISSMKLVLILFLVLCQVYEAVG